MKRSLIVLMAFSAAICAGALDFAGTADKVVTVVPEKSTGLEAVYVLRGTDGVVATYPSPTAVWKRFGAAGAAYAEPIASTVQGGASAVTLAAGDCGLLVEDAGRQFCYWVTDYSAHPLHLEGVAATGGEYACDNTRLSIAGQGDAIHYYSINGRELTLSRGIVVTCQSLVYDKEQHAYVQAEQQTELAGIGSADYVAAPLCNTVFTVSGDRFLREWGAEQSVQSAPYTAVAVAAHTTATQQERDVANEQKPTGGSATLGGSAPCEITFEAAVTDAAVYRRWEISRTPEFDIADNEFNDTEFTYTFTENGTFYVRFTAANSDGSCTFTGETYEVGIGESKLVCPNAFTPDSSPGVNDEWRVSYQSIVEFKCDIFSRHGARIITLTNPSQGWDGTYKGKKVGSGVYYYVIRARGADGRDYKLSGDINVVGSRPSRSAGTTAPAE